MVEPPFDYSAFDPGDKPNYWALNPLLQSTAERVYPEDEFRWANDRLETFGALVGDPIAENADRIDDHPPTLEPYDEYGQTANRVEYHPAQDENDERIYDHGIVADAFTPPPDRDDPVGVIHTLTEQLLLAYADTGLVCSQSMTSGVALVLDHHDDAGHYTDYLDRLTTRNPDEQIEGAMFLTEEQGGSDVGAIETIAEPLTAPEDHPSGDSVAPPDFIPDRTYALTGEKWFCSNIDAQATLVLARRQDAPEGTAGLSMFLVPHELPSGQLNHQQYRRLKDKLGTKSVPTGEVKLEAALGYLVGTPESGFKYMTTMLNWERVTNAVGAVGIIARLLLECNIYAANREAFGEPIKSFPLLQRDLIELTVDHDSTLTVAMEAARWYDRWHRNPDDQQAYRLMRLLAPISKHVTTRTAVETASYAMEIHGGNGYVNDFITHRLYRDAQALPIWEGTANILALDVLRTLDREAAHEALIPYIDTKLSGVTHPYLQPGQDTVRSAFESLQSTLVDVATIDADTAQYVAKDLAETIYDVLAGSLLLAHAQTDLDDGDARSALVADRFIAQSLDTHTNRVPIDDDRIREYFDSIVAHEPIDEAGLPPTTFNESS